MDRDLREDADLTQQQIALILGTSQTMYARYERGANELPIHHLLTLCKYYQVSADYILGLTNKKQVNFLVKDCHGRSFFIGCEMILHSRRISFLVPILPSRPLFFPYGAI